MWLSVSIRVWSRDSGLVSTPLAVVVSTISPPVTSAVVTSAVVTPGVSLRGATGQTKQS